MHGGSCWDIATQFKPMSSGSQMSKSFIKYKTAHKYCFSNV